MDDACFFLLYRPWYRPCVLPHGDGRDDPAQGAEELLGEALSDQLASFTGEKKNPNNDNDRVQGPRQHPADAVPADDGGPGVVAAGLQPEHQAATDPDPGHRRRRRRRREGQRLGGGGAWNKIQDEEAQPILVPIEPHQQRLYGHYSDN